MKQLIISNDVKLSPQKHQELSCQISKKFNDFKVTEISIRDLTWKQYQYAIKNSDVIVVLFAGYNLKRYWGNLVKHLITPSKTLYGINIEGHFFTIPKIRTLIILLKYKLKVMSLGFISRKFYLK